MNNMEKMQRYSILWGIILLLIVGLLTIFGFVYKSKATVYKELEEKIVESAKKYVDAKFLYPEKGDSIKITSEELLETEFLDALEKEEEECKGYVEVYKDGTVYKYKGYVSCPNYQTKSYKE